MKAGHRFGDIEHAVADAVGAEAHGVSPIVPRSSKIRGCGNCDGMEESVSGPLSAIAE